MSIEIALLIIMFIFLGTLVLGLPIAFVLISTGLLGILIFLEPSKLFVGFSSLYGAATSEALLALPLFILMSSFMRFSGIAEALFDTSFKWAGSLRGSLAIATILACTIIAALTGIATTGVVIMSLIAYPEMRKRGYDDELSFGSILGGGTLGPIIPPSAPMITIGMLGGIPIGMLFIGGIVPGLILCALFCLYVLARCYLQPRLGPASPPEMRATWTEKLISLKGVILPILLILLVLGSIYTGIATPNEAAGIGALGAGIIAAAKGKLGWKNLKTIVTESARITTMVIWLVVGGFTFTALLSLTGISLAIKEVFLGLEVSPVVMISVMMVVVVFFGWFVDQLTVTVICLPLFMPIVAATKIDPVYFGLIFALFSIAGYLTPPFGMSMFYLKGCLPEEVSIGKIYRAGMPYALMMILVAILFLLLPEILLWLPNKML